MTAEAGLLRRFAPRNDSLTLLLPHLLETGDEARERVGRHAARHHHFDERKPPAPRMRRLEGRGELLARRDPLADPADRARDIGEMPVVEIVEVRLRLESAQHFPTAIVEQHHDWIEPVAAAI